MTLEQPGFEVPDVSVVMPGYNAAATIERSIGSAVRLGIQRVIVVDDGSTDETATIAEASGATVVRQENAGASKARRVGLDLVETEFVILLDSDDVLLPGIQNVIDELRADAALGVVGGRYQVTKAKGMRPSVGPPPMAEYSVSDLVVEPRSPWPPCSAVWRMVAINDARTAAPAPLEPRFAEDYELLIRVALRYGVRGVNAIAAEYTTIGGKSTKSAFAALESARAVRDYYARHLNMTVRIVSDYQLREMAFWRLFRGTFLSSGIQAAVRFVAADPRSIPYLLSASLRRSLTRLRH